MKYDPKHQHLAVIGPFRLAYIPDKGWAALASNGVGSTKPVWMGLDLASGPDDYAVSGYSDVTGMPTLYTHLDQPRTMRGGRSGLHHLNDCGWFPYHRDKELSDEFNQRWHAAASEHSTAFWQRIVYGAPRP